MKHAIIALAATTATAFVARTAPVRAHVLRAEEGVAAEPVVAEVAEEKPKRADKSKATPLADLVEGNEYAGKITGLAAYGAFVDIGAQSDGLVHISELSASYVDDVASVVKEGDDVTVRILKIDSGKKQLSLSMKPEGAEAPPKKRGGGGRQKKAGAEELRKYQDADPAEFISGTVRTVLEWGAFVNIAPGVDGLVHISRVSDSRVEDLQAELSVGDEVKRKPRRMDPGDDIWENKDSFNWKDVLAEADAGDADDMSSGFSADLETGKLTLQ
ncbi:translation elongation factor [Aureococcus anophagefferens]|uniref:Translation elongation factor n=1 Tax=Aureococcus anophagefferens TaxID=44056 RepID=A0ABR1G4B2_AURAN